MKLGSFLPILVLMLAAWTTPQVARADMLYDSTSLIEGQQAFVQSFTMSTPGTLTMTVSNIPWLDAVSDLSFFVSTTKGVIGAPMAGAGDESINIGAGTFYAHWFGDAQGPYNFGVLGVKIQFSPGGATVPLPRSLMLLVSGLGLLFGWQRRRTPVLATG
ncbi:MAG: hypothetical protein ACLQUM_03930 [Steroidobacteraceae bacterium]